MPVATHSKPRTYRASCRPYLTHGCHVRPPPTCVRPPPACVRPPPTYVHRAHCTRCLQASRDYVYGLLGAKLATANTQRLSKKIAASELVPAGAAAVSSPQQQQPPAAQLPQGTAGARPAEGGVGAGGVAGDAAGQGRPPAPPRAAWTLSLAPSCLTSTMPVRATDPDCMAVMRPLIQKCKAVPGRGRLGVAVVDRTAVPPRRYQCELVLYTSTWHVLVSGTGGAVGLWDFGWVQCDGRLGDGDDGGAPWAEARLQQQNAYWSSRMGLCSTHGGVATTC